MCVKGISNVTRRSTFNGFAAVMMYLAGLAKVAGSTLISLANIVGPFLFVAALLVATTGSGSMKVIAGLGLHFALASMIGVCLYLIKPAKAPVPRANDGRGPSARATNQFKRAA